ncbi:hypothetical protein AYJ54_07170 [Bradyrhizobium centrolobii]|uniref:Uncharacterized protein n=1 Tax=Bradyrhizobium centrolobii TaxID=1505087 RepID=A0A176YX19_9BRAD|nr:hypothetical protein AYJ54_07170 [Bradyrhizobium centrolobii]
MAAPVMPVRDRSHIRLAAIRETPGHHPGVFHLMMLAFQRFLTCIFVHEFHDRAVVMSDRQIGGFRL